MGIAIEIPSGILCSAIAKDNFKPKLVLVTVEAYVATPSGMLWIIKVIVEIRPNL